MGMFDCYEPVPAIACRCGSSLDGWQGKGNFCELLTWTQGRPDPQLSRFALQYEPKNRERDRLPDGELAIYTQCAACEAWVDAVCVVVEGLWNETRVEQR